MFNLNSKWAYLMVYFWLMAAGLGIAALAEMLINEPLGVFGGSHEVSLPQSKAVVLMSKVSAAEERLMIELANAKNWQLILEGMMQKKAQAAYTRQQQEQQVQSILRNENEALLRQIEAFQQ